MKLQLVLIAFLFSFAQTGISQAVIMSQEIPLHRDQDYSIIGKFKNKTLVFQNKGTEYEIQAFNNALLTLSWTKKLDLGKNRPEVLEVFAVENYFYVVYKFQSKGSSIIKIHKYNEDVNIINTTNIFNYGKKINVPDSKIVLSENKKKLLLYHSESSNKVEVAVFDLDKMGVLWNQTYMPKDLKFDNHFQQMLVDNEGGMHLVLVRENEYLKKDKSPHFELIYQSSNGGNAPIHTVSLEGKLSYDVKFKLDNKNQTLVAAGMYSYKNKARTEGYYYLNFPYSNPEKKLLSFYEFKQTFKEKLVSKKKKITKGLSDVGIQNIVFKKEGGIIIIGEQIKGFERASGNASRLSYYLQNNGGNQYSVDRYYEDLFLFSVYPNGQHEWDVILNKKKFSQDRNTAFASFFLTQTPQSLRFIYSDEIKKESNVNEYLIKENGLFVRNNILNVSSEELWLCFAKSHQVASNEILIPSKRKNRLKLVRMLF